MMEVKLGAKELREFEQAWNALSNPKHKNRYYNVSPSKEEYRECWENGMPELFFDFGRWILREEAKTFLFRATDIIAKSDELYDVVSWRSVYETLKINLRDEIFHRISGSAKQELNQVVSNIKTQLEYKVDSFDFFFPLEGIELHEIQEINLKNIAIVHFDEDAAIKLTRLHLKGTDDCDNLDAFESTKKFFDRDFTNQLCVKSTAHGELSIARKKAYKQAKQVINT
jgi:hypothetical protein